MVKRVHIIGAGMSGLSAATHLVSRGIHVCLYEATKQAGGRCRSYHDPVLNRTIDNGNHLIIGANQHALDYIERIQAQDRFLTPPPSYDFIDVELAKTWQLKTPFYTPGTPLAALIPVLKLLLAGRHATVAKLFNPNSAIYRRWIEPICVSALNTDPDQASATMLRKVILRSCLKGKKAAQPYIAKESLHNALVEPALSLLKSYQADIYYQHILKHIETEDGRITQLRFANNVLTIAEDDRIVLALPHPQLNTFLPEIEGPENYSPIVNGHFLCDHEKNNGSILGLTGGHVDWIFFKGGLISTTTSAAHSLAEKSQDDIAKLLWKDVCRALGEDSPLPIHRIVTEKRATFACTPGVIRPKNNTDYSNSWIAGDYTNTGLPGTIDGAILSGQGAAEAIIASYS